MNLLLMLLIGFTAETTAFGESLRSGGNFLEQGTVSMAANIGSVRIQEYASDTMSVGFEVGVAAANNLVVSLSADYWQEEFDTDLEGALDVSDIVVGINSKLVFAGVQTDIKPYLALGLAGHQIESRLIKQTEISLVDSPVEDPWENAKSKVDRKIGADIGGGVIYALQKQVDINAQAMWRNLLEDSLDYDHMKLTVGVALTL